MSATWELSMQLYDSIPWNNVMQNTKIVMNVGKHFLLLGATNHTM